MKPLDSKKEYQNYVNKNSPNSPIIKNCFNAFWVGGLICSIGQIILSVSGWKWPCRAASALQGDDMVLRLIKYLQIS